MLPFSLMSMMYFDNTWCVPVVLIAITSGFYAATLEEYYCGRLDLPLLNGVSDGCLFIYAIGLVSAFIGTPAWQTKLFFNLTMTEIFSIALLTGSIITISSK